jgi:hypothetical protein
MNQNNIIKLHLEQRVRVLKAKGKSEREISRTLSEETRQNISKTAIHRCLIKQIEPVGATSEPLQTHQPIAQSEPQHIDTTLQPAAPTQKIIKFTSKQPDEYSDYGRNRPRTFWQ